MTLSLCQLSLAHPSGEGQNQDLGGERQCAERERRVGSVEVITVSSLNFSASPQPAHPPKGEGRA